MAKSKDEETAMVEYVDASAYTPIKLGAAKIQEILDVNMGDEEFNVSDLVTVKIPSGGGKIFEVGDTGEKTITGIVLKVAKGRSYWERDMEDPDAEGDAPPDCTSDDGKVGTGSPGGDCATCPLSKYGSKEGKRGQACKEYRDVFILPPEAVLPLRIRAAPTSIRAVRAFVAACINAMTPMHHIEVNIELESTKNKDGMPYSVLTLKPTSSGKMGRALAIQESQRPEMDEYMGFMIPILQQPVFEQLTAPDDDGDAMDVTAESVEDVPVDEMPED